MMRAKMKSRNKNVENSRRKTLSGILMAVPSVWAAPVVTSVVLPAHAQSTQPGPTTTAPPVTTPAPTTIAESSCTSDPQIRIFDDGTTSDTDDSFNLFIDGQLVLFLPAPANSTLGSCASGLTSGQHTLRIQFVQDIDNPAGDDNTQNGSYSIVLMQGLQFVSGPVASNCGVCESSSVTATTASGGLWPQGASHQFVISVP